MAKLEEVFGVTSKPIMSYVEREQVDTAFVDALDSGKQIIVYGSSKQGKTALVSKHLPYSDNLLVSLTPKTQLLDIYQTLLNKAGVRLVSSTTEKSGSEVTGGVVGRLRAIIPLFGHSEVEGKLESKATNADEIQYE